MSSTPSSKRESSRNSASKAQLGPPRKRRRRHNQQLLHPKTNPLRRNPNIKSRALRQRRHPRKRVPKHSQRLNQKRLARSLSSSQHQNRKHHRLNHRLKGHHNLEPNVRTRYRLKPPVPLRTLRLLSSKSQVRQGRIMPKPPRQLQRNQPHPRRLLHPVPPIFLLLIQDLNSRALQYAPHRHRATSNSRLHDRGRLILHINNHSTGANPLSSRTRRNMARPRRTTVPPGLRHRLLA